MAGILRGEIFWAEHDPTIGHEQSGRRPVLIFSEDVFNSASGAVIEIALTSQEPRAGFPLTMEITGSGLPKRTWAKISQIRTLSVLRLKARISVVGAKIVEQILAGPNELLGGR